MLYVFVSPKHDARARLHAHAKKVVGDVMLTRITADDIATCDIASYTTAQGLFSDAVCVFFDTVMQDKAAKEQLVGQVQLLSESPNHFFILEPALDALTLKKFEKRAQHIEVEKALAGKERSSGFFSLADALGGRDRKKLWVELVRARALGAAAEELHGVLWWGTKNMVLARDASSPAEVGLNPFVFQKAKRFASNYSEDELYHLADEVSTLLQRARRRNEDPGHALERFALAI